MNEPSQPPNRLWRIIRFPLVRMVLAFVWVAAIVSVTSSVVDLLPDWVQAISLPILALGACLGYYSFVRLVEKRPVIELAASGAVAELAGGVMIGAALFAVTIGILWGLGFYQVTGTNSWTVAIPALMSSVMAGVSEEILIRGVLFRMIEEWVGTWLALLVSALLFGLLHLVNPNADLVGAVAIALEAGIMLAAAYMLTRRLWLAIGIHFAWNFTQGGVFGVAVSGNQSTGLVQASLSGPELLSGGAFGAEASIVAVVVCLAAGVYMLWRARKKGNLVKPFWRR